MERSFEGIMFREVVSDVFFDLDHTLWDFDRNSGLTFQKILSENRIEISLDDFLTAYMPINLAYWKLFREQKINKTELRYLRLKRTFDSLGFRISNEIIHLLSEQYIEHLASFTHLLPYTREILDYLSPRYRLHIITNGFAAVQEKKLRNANILGYFDLIINSEMAGVKKPDPRIFLLALKCASVPASKGLMIGDNLEADILGAQAVGLHTLHYNVHSDPKHNYCNRIKGLHEIKSFL